MPSRPAESCSHQVLQKSCEVIPSKGSSQQTSKGHKLSASARPVYPPSSNSGGPELSQFVCEDSPEPSHTDVLMPRKFSQLEYYTALRGSGVVEEQALVIAQQASNIQEDILSSMSNEFRKLEKKIEGVEKKIEGVESKIEGVKTELKAKIKEAKGELKAEIKEAKGELKAEIKEAKGELDKVPGYILATPAATVALLGIGTAFWKAFFGPEKI